MGNVHITLEPSFLKSAQKLPQRIKSKLGMLLVLLENNPYHPLLHTKKLTGGLTGLFSFRITREWRAIFYFSDPRTIHLVDVAHRKDIYQ